MYTYYKSGTIQNRTKTLKSKRNVYSTQYRVSPTYTINISNIMVN